LAHLLRQEEDLVETAQVTQTIPLQLFLTPQELLTLLLLEELAVVEEVIAQTALLEQTALQ
jgi:hypothetical protein